MNKVIIFHSPLAPNAPQDELDVLDQAAFFEKALLEMGYGVTIMPFPYDILVLQALLHAHQPSFVVNLVETLFADGRLIHIAPFLFEHFRVPYSGCPASAIYTTSDKILAKKLMMAGGIPTPEFFSWEMLNARDMLPGSRFIIKSLWEHASFGMDEKHKLLFDNKEELLQKMQATGNPHQFFAEEYIHGREFNISMIDGFAGPQILPPAEIHFNYPTEKPRIVGYRAKWDVDSFEYNNTNRSFDFQPGDQQLLNRLNTICLKCWDVFELKGYARVDFRVDEKGNIYVLEINANPCISADSGFVAAAGQAGMTPKQIVECILKIN